MCSMSMGPHVVEGVVAELADVGDPVAHPARSRLARKTLLSTAASSAKPSISCGPRSLPAWGSMATISAPSGAERAMAIIERPGSCRSRRSGRSAAPRRPARRPGHLLGAEPALDPVERLGRGRWHGRRRCWARLLRRSRRCAPPERWCAGAEVRSIRPIRYPSSPARRRPPTMSASARARRPALGRGGRPPVSNAVPDDADPVAKIGDLAASAGRPARPRARVA